MPPLRFQLISVHGFPLQRESALSPLIGSPHYLGIMAGEPIAVCSKLLTLNHGLLRPATLMSCIKGDSAQDGTG